MLGKEAHTVVVAYQTDIPNGIGNGLGLLLGFVDPTAADQHVSQGAGKFAGKINVAAQKSVVDMATIKTWQTVAGKAAKLNKSARLLLHCSAVTSSRESDGKMHSDVIASIPNTGVALGHDNNFTPSVPIRCRTGLAGYRVDELRLKLTSSDGSRLNLGAEHWHCTLVVEYED